MGLSFHVLLILHCAQIWIFDRYFNDVAIWILKIYSPLKKIVISSVIKVLSFCLSGWSGHPNQLPKESSNYLILSLNFLFWRLWSWWSLWEETIYKDVLTKRMRWCKLLQVPWSNCFSFFLIPVMRSFRLLMCFNQSVKLCFTSVVAWSEFPFG